MPLEVIRSPGLVTISEAKNVTVNYSGGTVVLPSTDGIDVSAYREVFVEVVSDWEVHVVVQSSEDRSSWIDALSFTVLKGKPRVERIGGARYVRAVVYNPDCKFNHSVTLRFKVRGS